MSTVFACFVCFQIVFLLRKENLNKNHLDGAFEAIKIRQEKDQSLDITGYRLHLTGEQESVYVNIYCGLIVSTDVGWSQKGPLTQIVFWENRKMIY